MVATFTDLHEDSKQMTGIKRERRYPKQLELSNNIQWTVDQSHSAASYFVRFGCSRTLAAYAFSHSFKKIAKKFQLEVDCSFPHGSQVHCFMPASARELLFSSAQLEVAQTIVTTGLNSAVVFLDWHHPIDAAPIRGIEKGYRKRQRFVLLFVNLWSQALQKVQEYLTNNSDAALSEVENKISFNRKLERTPGPFENKMSTSKTKQVRFSPCTVRVEIPLTIEERESRMAFGAVSRTPCGQVKELRSLKPRSRIDADDLEFFSVRNQEPTELEDMIWINMHNEFEKANFAQLEASAKRLRGY